MRMNKYKLMSISLSLALAVVLTYAVGLTLGIGPNRVAEKFGTRIWEPITDRLSGDSILESYTEKPCPSENVFSIAYFGQSNATNTVYPPADISVPDNLLQYDWHSQKCFVYQEPLLGADFELGNSITYAAVEIAGKTDADVVIIPFGFGPSSVLVWAYGQGAVLQRLVLERVKARGFSPDIFLWHQGETDVAIDGIGTDDLADLAYFRRPDERFDMKPSPEGLSQRVYADALNKVVDRTLTAFPDTYFGVALASIAPCLGRDSEWLPVREAQNAVADSHAQVFISADSDMLSGPEYRHDTCHFSAEGARQLSAEYVQKIESLTGLHTRDEGGHVAAAVQ